MIRRREASVMSRPDRRSSTMLRSLLRLSIWPAQQQGLGGGILPLKLARIHPQAKPGDLAGSQPSGAVLCRHPGRSSVQHRLEEGDQAPPAGPRVSMVAAGGWEWSHRGGSDVTQQVVARHQPTPSPRPAWGEMLASCYTAQQFLPHLPLAGPNTFKHLGTLQQWLAVKKNPHILKEGLNPAASFSG